MSTTPPERAATTTCSTSALPLPHPLSLPDLVTAIDAAIDDTEQVELLRVTHDPFEVARRPLEGEHPLENLLGFTAPDRWSALGLHCPGRAERLDEDDPRGDDVLDVMLTFVLDRSGDGAGVMRAGSVVTRLSGPPGGVVGDACRRALGLATAPPPADTVELWLQIWLDRLIDSVAFLGRADRYASWEAVVELHPVATSASRCSTGGPVALADASRRLAEAWPWSRLRREPDMVDTPQPPLHPEVAAWMDDGMYARWILADLPSLPDLAAAAEALLAPPVRTAVGETVRAAGLPWPGS